jgi:integrase
MNSRRRTYQNKDLPQGLYITKVRGVDRFRFRRPDGKNIYFPVGTLRHDAIQAAILFNNEVRTAEARIRAKELANDKYNKPISEWIPAVLNRVKREELNAKKMNQDTFGNFKRDCVRLSKTLGNIYSKDITLEHVNEFLSVHANNASNNVFNRKISFLVKVFTYLVDESAMNQNYALQKKPLPKEDKKRNRLGFEEFKQMLTYARENKEYHYLFVAMSLALQTTQATLEVSRIKYSAIKNGILRIKRQKVQKHESSRVEIPVSSEIQNIIEFSRLSRLASPYVVHRVGRNKNQIGEGCDHPLQVSSKYISRQFSILRDKLGLYVNLSPEKRPTFHEIRALSIHLYKSQGVDPQTRAAHKDAKTTKIYNDGHVQWVRVPDAEINITF